MPNSYVIHTGTGSQTNFLFTAIDDYISTGYIKVYVDDVLQTTGYTINASTETVTFSAGYIPANGTTVKIARETPSTVAGFTGGIVDFADGSVITADDLDKGFKGILHIVQEANDTGSGALGKTTDQLGWDADGLPIKNAGYATDPNDLVTKSQLDSVALYGVSTVPQAWEFTGTGSQLTFTLDPLPSSTAASMFIVEVGGVLQRPTTDYSITTNAIVFVSGSAPGSGIGIRVRNFGVARNALDVIPSSSITSTYLADGAVITAKIAANAVTSAKLASNSVATASIQDDAVTQAKIADDAVGIDQMEANSVGTDQLVTGAVTTPKIANSSITSEKFAAASVDTTALGLSAVGLTNMKGTGFASAGVERVLHVNASGDMTAKALSTVGFGGTAVANLDFNSTYKAINLGVPSSNGDAIRAAEVLRFAQVALGYGILNGSSVRDWIVLGRIDSSNVLTTTSFTANEIFELVGTSNAVRPKTGQGTWSFGTIVQGTGPSSVIQTYVRMYTGITPSTAEASCPRKDISVVNFTGSDLLFLAIRTA